MRDSLANRAPFKGVQRQHGNNINLTQAVVDKDFVVVRWCGAGIDIEDMAREMNERAAFQLMVAGTLADPNMNMDIYSSFDDIGARYQK